MIKINLRPDVAAAAIDSDAGADVVDVDIQRKGLVNILIIFIIPAALYVYGMQVKPQKEAQIASLTSQISELSAFNDKQTAIVAEITKIKADELDVETKINAIANISKGRLAEIKVLDLLQSLMRDKMWLKSIEIDGGNKDGTSIVMEGMAQTGMDVSMFLEDLNKNTLFSKIDLDVSTITPYEGQNFSKFTISGFLEKTK